MSWPLFVLILIFFGGIWEEGFHSGKVEGDAQSDEDEDDPNEDFLDSKNDGAAQGGP